MAFMPLCASRMLFTPTIEDKPLRPYQREAVASILADLANGRTALLVLPVGCGKTRTFGEVAKHFSSERLRVLVLAHSIVLVDQAARALEELGLSVQTERAEHYARRYRGSSDVVAATVQTLTGKRLLTWEPDAFDLVVIDEAHRSLSDLHCGVVEHFRTARLLGVTATPDRTDGKALGNVFESVSYELDMLTAVRQGYLSRLEFRTVQTGWDPTKLKEVAGEVSAGSVEKELVRSGVLSEAADTFAELGAGRKVLAFLPTVASAHAFAVELRARGITAASISGETPAEQRAAIFRDFKSGAVSVLCNVSVLTEGFDSPDVNVVALLAPTKSRSRLVQMIGRGTRLAPGKDHCLILDFTPGRLKRGRLAAPADALAGKMLDDATTLAMPSEGDLVKALEAAEKTVEEIRAEKLEVERIRAERRDRMKALAQRPKPARYTQQAHDAGELMGGDATGVPVLRTKQQQPRSNNQASAKQAAILRKFGFNPNISRSWAGWLITRIAQHGWKMPDGERRELLAKHSALRPAT